MFPFDDVIMTSQDMVVKMRVAVRVIHCKETCPRCKLCVRRRSQKNCGLQTVSAPGLLIHRLLALLILDIPIIRCLTFNNKNVEETNDSLKHNTLDKMEGILQAIILKYNFVNGNWFVEKMYSAEFCSLGCG